MVRPNRPSRADLDVIRLGYIEGTVTGPRDVPLDSIVIHMSPGGRYTTPDTDGKYFFYNVREGSYELALDLKTLPEDAIMAKSDPITVSVKVNEHPAPTNFQ